MGFYHYNLTMVWMWYQDYQAKIIQTMCFLKMSTLDVIGRCGFYESGSRIIVSVSERLIP